MCGYFCIGFIDFMLAGKKLTDFTSTFSPYDLKKNAHITLSISKMNEIDKTILTDQTKIRVNKISEIENYFNSEAYQRKSCSKKLSKYVAAFDYIDKILIVLSATTGGVSIISFTSIIGAPVGIASASFTLIFFSNNRNNKKVTKYNKKQKEKT